MVGVRYSQKDNSAFHIPYFKVLEWELEWGIPIPYSAYQCTNVEVVLWSSTFHIPKFWNGKWNGEIPLIFIFHIPMHFSMVGVGYSPKAIPHSAFRTSEMGIGMGKSQSIFHIPMHFNTARVRYSEKGDSTFRIPKF